MQLIDKEPLYRFPGHISLSWQRRVLHFRTPATTSRGALRQRVTYTVHARCGEAHGWGECCVMPGLLPEINERDLDLACAEIESAQSIALKGLSSPIRFGVESALLSVLQGGNPRWDTPFTRGQAGIPIHCLIWMADAGSMQKKMQEGVERGFSCLKMKVGALPIAVESALIRHIKQAFPQVEIRVDANGAFSPREALYRCEQLAQAGVSCIEQPIRPRQWQQMAELCRHSPLPIALDEELLNADEPERLLDAVQPQALVIKPSLHGGLIAAEQWAEAANARGITHWVNSALESHIGLDALAEWCAYFAPEKMQALGTGLLYADDSPGRTRLLGNQLKYSPV